MMKPFRIVLFLLTAAPLIIDASLIPFPIQQATSHLSTRLKRSHEPNSHTPVGQFPKYFKEPDRRGAARHYDHRYEHGVLNDDLRRDAQLHMMRAYLAFFERNGMETWLAHGTLLGWWWNAKILPWDSDIDAQVSGPTLASLAAHFNGTIFDYNSLDYNYTDATPNAPPILRQYLLDINPAVVNRSYSDSDNVIDARWIDIRNGLFIDITGLFETQPETAPGVWQCKNDHQYQTKELYPMRSSIFEGVAAKVPYSYDRILTDEYQEKALVLTDYEGHRWNTDAQEWIKKTALEIKKEKADRQEARRKRLAEKEARRKEKAAKKKGAKVEATTLDEGYELDEGIFDQGLQDPEEEPARAKRAVGGAVVGREAVKLMPRGRGFGVKALMRRRGWLRAMTSHDEN